MSGTEDEIHRLADCIATGQPVDWAQTERGIDDVRLMRIVRELRAIARIADSYSPRDPDAPHLPFSTWGSLRLLGRIGAGGDGEVFRAWDETLHREVALKLYRATATHGTSDQDRLLTESRNLAQVRHPNVVQVFGADVHNGRMGFWTELLVGETLESLVVRRRRLSAAEAAAIGISLCRGLAAIHGAGLLHRDIKPANAFIESSGRICLLDLGSGVPQNQSQDRRGTPLFMAPEAFLHGTVSVQSDVYSLGALLFNAVTGSVPIEPTTGEALTGAFLHGETRRIGVVRPDLPVEFQRIVDRCLDGDPKRRFASASELERQLALFAAIRPTRHASRAFAAAGAVAVLAILDTPQQPWRNTGYRISVQPFQFSEATGARNVTLSETFTLALAKGLAREPRLRIRTEQESASIGAGSPASTAFKAADRVISGVVRRDSTRFTVTTRLAGPWNHAVRDSTFFVLGDLSTALAVTQQQLRDALGIRSIRRYPDASRRIGNAPGAAADFMAAGLALAQLKREEALVLTTSLINQYPNDSDAWVCRLGALWLQWISTRSASVREQIELADAKARKLDPSDPYPDFIRASLALNGQSKAVGLEICHRLLERPDLDTSLEMRVLSLRANVRNQTGDAAGAEADFRRAMEMDPTWAGNYMRLGGWLAKADRLDEALQLGLRAVELAPSLYSTHEFLGLLYEQLGRPEDSLVELEHACELGGNQAPCTNYAIALLTAGHRKRADAAYERAVLLPNSPNGVYNLACYAAAVGRKREALLWLETAIDLGFWGDMSKDPSLDPIRKAPLYAVLWERVRVRRKAIETQAVALGLTPSPPAGGK